MRGGESGKKKIQECGCLPPPPIAGCLSKKLEVEQSTGSQEYYIPRHLPNNWHCSSPRPPKYAMPLVTPEADLFTFFLKSAFQNRRGGCRDRGCGAHNVRRVARLDKKRLSGRAMTQAWERGWTSVDLRDVWVGSLYSRTVMPKKELQFFGFVLVPWSVMKRLMASSLFLSFFLLADAKHLCSCHRHNRGIYSFHPSEMFPCTRKM